MLLITTVSHFAIGDTMVAHVAMHSGQNLGPEAFMRRLMGSRAVLAVPGMGYDCWRIWETMLAG